MDLTTIDPAQFFQTHVQPFGINLLIAVLIFFVGRAVARGVSQLSIRLLNRNKNADPMLAHFIGNTVYGLALTIVVIAALSELGVQTSSLVAVIGAAGLAIGLALQGSLANFAAGIMLLAFKPFRQGHFIEAAGTSGIVENISIFSTTLRTGDNREVILPNGSIYSGNIINYSAKDTRRIDLIYGIAYDADIRLAKQILEGLLAADDRILTDPEPVIAVGALNDSSVDLFVRPWVATADYWPVLFDLNEKVKLAFDEQGVGIPFPTMDLKLPPELTEK